MRVKVTDNANNTNESKHTFELDTQTTAPAITLTHDTGTTGDDKTKDASLTVKTDTDTANVEYFVTKDSDAELASMTATEYQAYIDAQEANHEDGHYTVRVKVTDDAGNTDITTSSSLLLDTQLTAVSAERTSDNHYIFNLESVTADTSGLKDVKVYKEGTTDLLFTVTYNGGTVGTISPEKDVVVIGDITNSSAGISITAEGEYRGHLTIITTDMAGNAPVSSSTNISLPTVTFLEDTGRSQTDHNSQNGEITVKATGSGADEGKTLWYRENGAEWKEVKNGSFNLAEGVHENVEIKQISFGGTSSPSVSLGTITIDKTNPDTPTAPTVLNDQDASNAVLVASTTPTLTGTVEANANVTLTYNNGHTQTVLADATTGKYSITLNEALEQGNNAIGITATDVAGNKSHSLTQTIQVDTEPPSATVKIGDTSLIAGETTTLTVKFSEVPKNFVEADDLIVQGGTLSNGSFDAAGLVYTATFTPTANTEVPENIITLGQAWTDAAGNAPTADVSTSNFSIDTKVPSATVTIDDTSLIAGETTTLTVTFTEKPTHFNANNDLIVEGGTLSNNGSFDATGLVYTTTFTPYKRH